MKLIINEQQYKLLIEQEDDNIITMSGDEYIEKCELCSYNSRCINRLLKNKDIVIEGNLWLSFSEDLTTLGNIVSVDGTLILMGCTNLTSLGKLKYVGKHLDLVDTPIAEQYTEEQIRQMVEVGGNLRLS